MIQSYICEPLNESLDPPSSPGWEKIFFSRHRNLQNKIFPSKRVNYYDTICDKKCISLKTFPFFSQNSYFCHIISFFCHRISVSVTEFMFLSQNLCFCQLLFSFKIFLLKNQEKCSVKIQSFPSPLVPAVPIFSYSGNRVIIICPPWVIE